MPLLHMKVDSHFENSYSDLNHLKGFPGSEITPCIKIDRLLVVYRVSSSVMTFITTLRE